MEAEVLGQLLVHQAEGVRERLGVRRSITPSLGAAGEVRVALAAAVEHEHRGTVERRRVERRGGVGEVVRHEPARTRAEPGQRASQELRCPLRT